MVVIREVGDGRFEVYAAERHWEAFDGMLGAVLTAQGLAGQIASETGRVVTIRTPWGDKQLNLTDGAGNMGAIADSCEACISSQDTFGSR